MKTSDPSRNAWRRLIRHLIGLISLPIIGLYIVAYRLMGKPCIYYRGEIDVRPVEPLTENQYLFTRLFPALIPLSVIALVSIASRLLIIGRSMVE